MKNKLYILGMITAILVFTGTIFKINHWPAAGIMITVGLVSLVILFIPTALINHYKAAGNKQNLLLYIITWLTCFVIFVSMLFKIMHWPGAGTMLANGLPFAYVVFLPVFLITTSKIKNYNIYNTVFVLLLLAVNSVFAALLALNVSRERIHDSYGLSANYIKVKSILDNLPVSASQSPVNLKLEEVLKVVYNYQNLIFVYDGTTKEAWNKNQDVLFSPDRRDWAVRALKESGEVPVASKLQKGLKELVTLMEHTPGYEGMAGLTIYDPGTTEMDENKWFSRTFGEDAFAWSVIYLDGLETNLKLIKGTMK